MQDTATGAIVAQHRTRMGTCDVMRQNPWNAVMHLGHSNGVVSMWTPNMSTPVVKMLCHKVGANCIIIAAGLVMLPGRRHELICNGSALILICFVLCGYEQRDLLCLNGYRVTSRVWHVVKTMLSVLLWKLALRVDV